MADSSMPNSAKAAPPWRVALAIVSILTLLVLPSVTYLLVGGLAKKAALYTLVALSMYGAPMALVHNRLHAYAVFLYRIALFSPVILLTAYFGLPFDDRVMLFAREAGGVASRAFAGGCVAIVLSAMVLFSWLYREAMNLVPQRMNRPAAVAVSVFSLAVLVIVPAVVARPGSYPEKLLRTSTYVYPFNLPRAVFTFGKRSWLVSRFS